MATGRMRKVWILGLFAWGTLTACPDPEERFEEFVDRTERFREPRQGPGAGALADLEGRFLLSASVELSPGSPLFFDVEIETNYSEDEGCPREGCLLHMKVLPLVSPSVVGQVCEPPFTPAGIAIGTKLPDEARDNPEPIEIRDIPVDEDGTFRVEFPMLAVDGCANSISGRLIVARLELESVIKSEDRFCGGLGGELRKPLKMNLTRSTFGAERIEADPADLDPRPILTACPPDEDDEEEEEDENQEAP